MDQFAKETLPVSLEEEMRRSYLDYAMSVIVGRALPDVRDGLKPVHRRVLYAMQESNIVWNRPYVKCARVVGDVMGKYHPHGDTAIYDTLVRMAQDFSMRYPLIDGQGNFGSVDGDNPAAMRYTECRLSRIAAELLADIDSETVDFVPNYDGKEQEPAVLPTRLPNLLVNGSSGIAVGMATNIPPHNLSETITACLALLANPDIAIEELIKLVPAPDFPTAGLIYGTAGIHEGYRTGRGRVVMRARTHVEDIDKGARQAIVVDELPYQCNKKVLLERIAELVHEKKIDGISHIQDESDKSGMRVVIELKRGELPEVVLNNLYKQTQLQDTFGINMVALVDGQPKLLGLKAMLANFLAHRREVVTRCTSFDLRKARERAHVQEGLAVALERRRDHRADQGGAVAGRGACGCSRRPGARNSSPTCSRAPPTARRGLAGGASGYGLGPDGYRLSETQAQRILEMQLQRLTALEQDKIVEEYKELLVRIADLLDILARPARITAIIADELTAIKAAYGDARKSEIVLHAEDIAVEDLIAPQDVVVTFSHAGYIKAQPVADYRAQRRGGRGKQAASMREDDFIERVFIAHTHDFILCFESRAGLLAEGVRSAGRDACEPRPADREPLPARRGRTHQRRAAGEELRRRPVRRHGDGERHGQEDAAVGFLPPAEKGIIAVDLEQGDYLIGVAITGGQSDGAVLGRRQGGALRGSRRGRWAGRRAACAG